MVVRAIDETEALMIRRRAIQPLRTAPSLSPFLTKSVHPLQRRIDTDSPHRHYRHGWLIASESILE
jgi:hypothetical protein